LRNHAKKKYKALLGEELDQHPQTIKAPTTTATTTTTIRTTTLSPWRSRQQFKSKFSRHPVSPLKDEESFALQDPQPPSSVEEETRSKVYLPGDSFADPWRSLPLGTSPTTPTPTTRWQLSDDYLHHSHIDEEFQSPKKSRGLPILSQLGTRPVTPLPVLDHSLFFQRVHPTSEIFSILVSIIR